MDEGTVEPCLVTLVELVDYFIGSLPVRNRTGNDVVTSKNHGYSVGAVVDCPTAADWSFINSATNSVIHQKNRLMIKNSQKLRPFLRAIFAGQKAKNIHKAVPRISKNISADALIVYPKKVVASMYCSSVCYML